MEFKEFFVNFSKNAKTIADKAVKKTGEVAESAKLIISLKSEEAKLERLFNNLGKLCYDKADDASIAALIIEIDDQKEVIAKIKADIAANSGKAYCISCGKEITSDAIFCPYCGNKQEQKKNMSSDAEPKTTEIKPEPETKETETQPVETASEVKAEARPDSKPLSAEEFVEYFKAVMQKYGFTK